MKKEFISTIRNVIDAVLVIMLFTVTAYAMPSEGVTYDNTNSGSSATTVNEALDDLYTKVNDKQTEINRINGIGDALPSQILSGKTAYVKGKTITGTIPSKGATTYTPGKSNQTIGAGNYLSGAQTIKGDANLVAGNIAKGKTIFGVSGTYTSDANAAAWHILSGNTAYVNGSKITGTMANNANKTVTGTKSISGNNTRLKIPSAGYYDTNSYIQISNTGLLNSISKIAENDFKGIAPKTTYSHTYELVAGGYYILIPLYVFTWTETGWEGWAQTSVTMTNGTVINYQANGQMATQVVDNRGAARALVYTAVAPIIFRADASTVTINYNAANNINYANAKWILYRIY